MEKKPNNGKFLKGLLVFMISGSVWTVNQINAQPTTIAWDRIYGGSDYDMPSAIIQTNDGGYIASGTTLSSDGDVKKNYGGADGLLLKLDAKGNLQWQRTYGGLGDDQINTIIQLKNGDFVVAGSESTVNGYSCVNHGFRDAWAMRLSRNGKVIWEKFFGGSLSESFNSAFETPDGGCLFVGSSSSADGDLKSNYGNSDYWMVKTNSNGQLLWEKTFGSERSENLFKAIASNDGSYILAGITRESKPGSGKKASSSQVLLMKIDESGNKQYQTSIGNSQTGDLSSLDATADGGCIIGIVDNSPGVGHTDSLRSMKKVCCIVKLSNTGSVEWKKTLDNIQKFETPTAVFQIDNSNYLVCGTAHSVNACGKVMRNKGSFWISQINSDFSTSWETTLFGQNRMISPSFEISADGSVAMMAGLYTRGAAQHKNKGFEDFRIVKLDFLSKDRESSQKSD